MDCSRPLKGLVAIEYWRFLQKKEGDFVISMYEKVEENFGQIKTSL